MSNHLKNIFTPKNFISIRYLLLAICLVITTTSNAQKYDFVNFGIEQGLVQSQANNLVIDKNGFLWVSTQGGVSRFDGKEFKNINYSKGLAHSFAEHVFADSKSNIWIASGNALQICNNKTMHLLSAKYTENKFSILRIGETAHMGMIVLANDYRLYRIDTLNYDFEPLSQEKERVMTFCIDSNSIHTAIYKKGLYYWNGREWIQEWMFPQKDSATRISQLLIDKYDNGIVAIAMNRIMKLKDGHITDTYFPEHAPMICAYQFDPTTFFIGTFKGAYKWNIVTNEIEFLGLEKGLSDNAINQIIDDKEGNLWFATDGNGVYRYRPNSNIIYDASSGLSGNVIMAIVQDNKSNIYAGSLEHGLTMIQHGKVIKMTTNPFTKAGIKINALTMDYDQNLWIGTIGIGLWKMKGKQILNVGNKFYSFPKSITSIYQHTDSSLWITSPRGVHKMYKDKITFIKGIKRSCFTVFPLNKDSLLLGTTQGISVVDIHSDSAVNLNIPGVNNFLVGSIEKFNSYVAIGTSENGITLWDFNHELKTYVCNESSGLSSSMIFSLMPDGNDLYAGTINGLNRINFDSVTHTFRVRHLKAGNQLGPECNQHAILKDAGDKIWVGTTKGIYVYNPHLSTVSPPNILMNSIDIFSSPLDSIPIKNSRNEMGKSSGLHLGPGQNHLTFKLQGIHLSAGEDILYQYYLSGADNNFSEPQKSSSIIYPNLAPGQYTFKAKAILGIDPSLTSDVLSYAFEIDPPIYQKTWFRICIVLALVLLGSIIQRYRMYLKTKQLKLMEVVRKQEQIKIQQRTSEDLHDDLGNKITRLSLLTDILQTKLAPNDDQQKIVNQIKENIQGLYMGTKDIIWALAPNNHTLYDTIGRIQNFATELLNESDIEFYSEKMDEPLQRISPPFDYSRNLIMICKEALHNVLKHSQASCVTIQYEIKDYQQEKHLQVKILDNGMGFNMNEVKKGNGLENMQKRAVRIQGRISIIRNQPQGTIIILDSKIPQSA